MKKILGILSIFLALGFFACIGIGFTKDVYVSLSAGSVKFFKFLTGLEYFFSYLPAIAITGFVVSCCVYFGKNSEGSLQRFSPAMMERYKSVMISALIVTFVFSMGNEVCLLRIRQKRVAMINQPKIINEYMKIGASLYEAGEYEKAIIYADAALKLNKNYQRAVTLKEKADIELNRQSTSNLRFKLYQSAEEESRQVDRVKIDAVQLSEVYQYYLKAQECFDKKEWFNAHYYAQLGVNLATPKDPNLESLKQLSTSAWNNITEWHDMVKSQNQLDFQKKYEGYLALAERDDLKAYYIFRELWQSSRELQNDPDVNFYLSIAERRINEHYFFIDETLELQGFESANDIYFAYEYKDGSKDIVYFKGMTVVKETGNSIQYLRDLTIKSIAHDGEVLRTMTVPYAKVLPVSVKSMNSTTKMLMGIDDKIEFVPYLMLKSVDRDIPNIQNSPLYEYESGETATSPEYMMLPISYSDFIMLETYTNDPSIIPLFSLFTLVSKAPSYGYSSEVFGQVLLNRIFYPLWILILLILLASVGWNNRVYQNQYFKLSWALGFPFFIALSALVYRISLFVFKLINYVMLGTCGTDGAIAGCLIVYAVFLVIASVCFLARRSRQ